MLQHNIVFVNILQGAYRIADICFQFEKNENIKEWNSFRIFIYNNSWRMQIFRGFSDMFTSTF